MVANAPHHGCCPSPPLPRVPTHAHNACCWHRTGRFAQILEWEAAELGKRQAHVVAPCPHDGHCPMDGTTSWCHFTQRFERPRMQRLAKIRDRQPLPRSYQDERFSYVVLRKKPRPPAAGEVTTREHLDL